MSFIPIVPPDEADAELRSAYQEVSGRRGRVANILGIHSVHPGAMVAHLRLYQELMFAASPLTRIEREMVAVTVSYANRCRY